MEIIPVIDICRGHVVHAIKGQRSAYQPVNTILSADSNPVSIVQSFVDLYPFKIIYIADLDAINGMQINNTIIKKLTQQFQEIDFWIDEGNSTEEEINLAQEINRYQVIGSETGVDPGTLNILKKASPQPKLSLDFKDGNFIGNMAVLQEPLCWPDDVIVMNISRVGSAQGPDLELLNRISGKSEVKNLYLAGGIRNIYDLQTLREENLIAGVLIATAFHTGTITGKDIRNFITFR